MFSFWRCCGISFQRLASHGLLSLYPNFIVFALLLGVGLSGVPMGTSLAFSPGSSLECCVVCTTETYVLSS